MRSGYATERKTKKKTQYKFGYPERLENKR